MKTNVLKFKINRANFIKILIYVTIILVLFNLIGIILNNNDITPKFHKYFYMNLERNVPALYSSIILLISSFLLYVISIKMKITEDNFNKHWKYLSIIFLIMSIDETASIHERLIQPIRELFNLNGFFYFSWVIVGLAVVFVIGLIYLNFLFKLPHKIRNQFIIAFILYIGGAIGVELPEGYYYEIHGENITFSLMVTLEESLEMFGIIVFINVLLKFIYINKIKMQVEFID